MTGDFEVEHAIRLFGHDRTLRLLQRLISTAETRPHRRHFMDYDVTTTNEPLALDFLLVLVGTSAVTAHHTTLSPAGRVTEFVEILSINVIYQALVLFVYALKGYGLYMSFSAAVAQHSLHQLNIPVQRVFSHQLLNRSTIND